MVIFLNTTKYNQSLLSEMQLEIDQNHFKLYLRVLNYVVKNSRDEHLKYFL